jgi:hypothetical protein
MRTQICASSETLFQNHPQRYEKLDSTDKHSQIKTMVTRNFYGGLQFDGFIS